MGQEKNSKQYGTGGNILQNKKKVFVSSSHRIKAHFWKQSTVEFRGGETTSE